MTSAPIQDFAAVQSYQSSKNADGGVRREELFGSFQNAMAQAKDDRTGSVKDMSYKNSVAGSHFHAAQATVKGNEPERTVAKDQTEEASKTDSIQENTPAGDKETVDAAVEKTEREVVSEIAKELGVSEEEVVAAMEALGLTVMDLLNPSNMAALMNQITGEGDSLALLTDESLFRNVTGLTEQVAAIINENAGLLSEELDIDLQKALAMMEQALTQKTEAADTAGIKEVIVEIDGELAAGDDLQAKEQEIGTTDASAEEIAGQQENGLKVAVNDGEQGKSMMNANQEASPLANQLYQPGTAHASAETVNAEMPFTSHVDTENIIRQIADYVRIHNTEGISEMELSLNPESLGRIHLQVASREGAITATITAQNETVREALMLQAVVLKEQLNEQGLKVDAVEVTIASHEFERNMENGGGEAKNLFEEQVKKQTRRRIVIDSLRQAEEMLSDETLSDAEKLQIDMMTKSGSSVDFTA